MNMIPAAAKAFKPADYKSSVKPVWCPGCGDHSVLLAFQRALAELALPPEQVAVVSGIGCSSRIPAYTNCYGFHGVHGRALALASGLKVARPDLTVARRQRRRRRLLDRRQSLPARLPAQHRSDLYRHGQPHLRHDEGSAIADDGTRLGHGHRAGRHGTQPLPPPCDRAGFRGQFHRARFFRRHRRLRQTDRRGGSNAGLLLRADPEPLRHLPGRPAERLEESGP